MSTDAQVRNVLQDMEDDIYAVENFARLLSHVASSPSAVEAECLNALGIPLLVIGRDLRTMFKKAFAAAGGQAS